jgi:hypothetical protein
MVSITRSAWALAFVEVVEQREVHQVGLARHYADLRNSVLAVSPVFAGGRTSTMSA